MKQAYHFIKPYWKKGLIPVLFLFIATIISFVYPLFPKWAIDEIVAKNMENKLLPLAIGFFILIILQRVFSYLNEISFFEFQKESILGIQKKLTEKVFNYPMEFFDKNHSGYLMGRIRGDVAGLSYIFSESIVMVFMDCFKFLGSFIILLSMNVKLTLICVLVMPLLVLRILASRRDIKKVNKKIIEENARLEKELSDTFQGVEVLKSFSKEEEGKNRVTAALKEFQKIEVKQNRIFSKYNNYIDFIITAGQVLLLYFGIKEIFKGTLTLGGYIAFMGYLIYLYSPIQNLSGFLIFFDYAKRSYDRVKELLNIMPEDSGNKTIEKIESINIKDLHFSYSKDKEVIKNFSLFLKKGDKVLISGESGSGKSTLMKLLLGLYRPDKGQILFNNNNIKELDLKSLRQKIGSISQNIFLFNKSIRDNIIFDDREIDDTKIMEILEKCCIKNKVMSLKSGLDHIVSEKGSDFSGGEKQRLSLARALIKKPDVILMDEAMANLDIKMEEEIEKIIFNHFKDKIIIKITHRETKNSKKWKLFSLKKTA